MSFRAKAIDAKGTNATPDADQRRPHHEDEVNGKKFEARGNPVRNL